MSSSIESLLQEQLDFNSYEPNGAMLAEAVNAVAQVLLAADINNDGQWYIDTVCVSYSAAPTGGLLTVYAGATPIFRADIIAGGPTTVGVFKKGNAPGALSVALSPGGSGITGRVNVNAKLM